jgi:hypothetical protein
LVLKGARGWRLFRKRCWADCRTPSRATRFSRIPPRPKAWIALDGANSYHLHVPPNVPAKQFWTVTVCDVDTRSIILNKEQIAVRGSRDDLAKNADGSVDLYFAPTAPKGLEKNWIQTVPGRAWFGVFRFYAPLEPYFDKSWPLPDIEKVN